MKSTNFNMLHAPSKTLGDHPRQRRWGKDGPLLSFATKCKGRATYDLNVEAISFVIGQGWRSQLIRYSWAYHIFVIKKQDLEDNTPDYV